MSHPKNEAIMVKSVLLKDTSAATGQAGIRTHILTTPELESPWHSTILPLARDYTQVNNNNTTNLYNAIYLVA